MPMNACSLYYDKRFHRTAMTIITVPASEDKVHCDIVQAPLPLVSFSYRNLVAEANHYTAIDWVEQDQLTVKSR